MQLPLVIEVKQQYFSPLKTFKSFYLLFMKVSTATYESIYC